MIRQIIPGNSDFLTIGDKSLSIRVLNSTFNQQNANYSVVVDDNVIINKKSGQPIFGIEKGFLNYRTGKYKVFFLF